MQERIQNLKKELELLSELNIIRQIDETINLGIDKKNKQIETLKELKQLNAVQKIEREIESEKAKTITFKIGQWIDILADFEKRISKNPDAKSDILRLLIEIEDVIYKIFFEKNANITSSFSLAITNLRLRATPSQNQINTNPSQMSDDPEFLNAIKNGDKVHYVLAPDASYKKEISKNLQGDNALVNQLSDLQFILSDKQILNITSKLLKIENDEISRIKIKHKKLQVFADLLVELLKSFKDKIAEGITEKLKNLVINPLPSSYIKALGDYPLQGLYDLNITLKQKFKIENKISTEVIFSLEERQKNKEIKGLLQIIESHLAKVLKDVTEYLPGDLREPYAPYLKLAEAKKSNNQDKDVTILNDNNNANVNANNFNNFFITNMTDLNINEHSVQAEDDQHLAVINDYMSAANQGELEVIKEILEKNPSIIDATAGEFGASALHLAALSLNKDVIEYLLQQGIDRYIKDNSGETALDWILQNFEYSEAKEVIDLMQANSFSAKM